MNSLSRWGRAIPLSKAWRHFAPTPWLKHLDALAPEGGGALYLLEAAKAIGEGTTLGFLDQQARHNRAMNQEWAIKAHVLKRLQSVELLGYGFALPRNSGDSPALIPADVWGGEAKWHKDEVKGAGLQFVSVRLEAKHSGLSITPPPPLPAPKVGRPGAKTAINSAFNALLADGRLDSAQPKARAYPLIRSWLAVHHPEWAEINDKTLQRHTAPLFNALKTNKT